MGLGALSGQGQPSALAPFPQNPACARSSKVGRYGLKSTSLCEISSTHFQGSGVGGGAVLRGQWEDTGWFYWLWWEQACSLCPHPVLGRVLLSCCWERQPPSGEKMLVKSIRVEGGSDPQGASVLLEAALGLGRSPYPNATP